MRNKLVIETVTLSAFLIALGAAAPARAESSGQYMDDVAISTKVRAAFLGDQNLRGSNLSVETDNAKVYVTGLVVNPQQEAEAVRVASQVDGVQTVKDSVTVRGSQDQ